MIAAPLLQHYDSFLEGLASRPLTAGLTLFGITILLLIMRMPSGRPIPVIFHISTVMMGVPFTLMGAAGVISFTVAISTGLMGVVILTADELYYALYPAFDIKLLAKDIVFLTRGLMKKFVH